MAYKEKAIEKKYFSIGEVAEKLNITTSQIRFWESEFDTISPQKNRNGKRQFTKEDIENIKMVHHLVKEKLYTLDGARQMLKNNSKTLKSKVEMIESLEEIKLFLTELKQKLDNQ